MTRGPLRCRTARPCTLSTPVHSPFLQLPITTWIASNDLAFAIPAPLPDGPGHTLIAHSAHHDRSDRSIVIA
jgi:hypothetical protein